MQRQTLMVLIQHRNNTSLIKAPPTLLLSVNTGGLSSSLKGTQINQDPPGGSIRSTFLFLVLSVPVRWRLRWVSPRRRAVGSWCPAPLRRVWLRRLLRCRSTPWWSSGPPTWACWSPRPSAHKVRRVRPPHTTLWTTVLYCTRVNTPNCRFYTFVIKLEFDSKGQSFRLAEVKGELFINWNKRF